MADEREEADQIPLPDEFYFEGPYIIFTEAYHLRRGYCCRSGCRHCPYGFRNSDAASPQE